MNETECYIFLNLLSIGYRSVLKLKNKFGTLKDAMAASKEHLLQVQGIRKATIESIVEKRTQPVLLKELDLIKKAQCALITFDDESYPESLRHIDYPPLVLYVRGELKPDDKNAIAIVGTRTPTRYGKKTAYDVSYQLASEGVTVVSGLAKGLDSEAHLGALEAKGRTIGILGSGLLRMYPRENEKLARRIMQNGAVMSEFPLETEPFRSNFPIRNRVISGMTLGTVVIEAAAKSGTLITAGFALEQGRAVFAVPGNVDQPTSEGANALIKQGATLMQTADDIFRELPSLTRKKGTTPLAQKSEPVEKLAPNEQKIMKLLADKPVHIDEITEGCDDMSAAEISVLLLTLEIKNIIKQLPGKYYVRV